jgi:hypothetical protein
MNGHNVKADHGLLHPFICAEMVVNSLTDIKLCAGEVVYYQSRAEYTGIF